MKNCKGYQKLVDLRDSMREANILGLSMKAYSVDEAIKILVEEYGMINVMAAINNGRKGIGFHNFSWFDQTNFPSGKSFGEAFAENVRNSVFIDLCKHEGSTEYDDDLNGLRIEQKAIRMFDKTKGDYLDRALNKSECSCNNRTWQQAKPHYFDVFLGAVLYKDCTDYYLIPSNEIWAHTEEGDPDKVRLYKQHGVLDKRWGQIKPPEDYVIFSDTPSNPLRNKSLLSIIKTKNYDRI